MGLNASFRERAAEAAKSWRCDQCGQTVIVMDDPDDSILRWGPVALDLGRARVTVDGRPVRLRPSERRILRALMERRGRVLGHAEISDLAQAGATNSWAAVEERRSTADRRSHIYICLLRRQLGVRDLIVSVSGVGYRLGEQASPGPRSGGECPWR